VHARFGIPNIDSTNPNQHWYTNTVGNPPQMGGTTTINAPMVPVSLEGRKGACQGAKAAPTGTMQFARSKDGGCYILNRAGEPKMEIPAQNGNPCEHAPGIRPNRRTL
jgi:hypothetical protein